MKRDKIEYYAEKAHLDKKEFLLYIWNGLVITHLLILLVRWIYCFFFLQEYIISNNGIYIGVATVLPAIVWVLSTTTDYWNFHNRKMMTATIVLANAVLTALQPLYTFLWKQIVMRVMKLTPSEVLTQSMILMLARVLMAIPMIIVLVIIILNIFKPIYSDTGKDKIAKFKIKNYIDTRENKDNLYDMKVVKNLKTGQDIIIKENDRFTHTVINGVSGTGKTSSTMVVSIYDDLEKKVRNRNKRQYELAQMVIENKAEVRKPLPKDPFEDPIIVPRKKYKQEYLNILKKYPDCGITVMAPNCGLTDDVVKICEAFGIQPAVIDPMPDEKTHRAKKYLTGINPFYVSDKLDEEEKAAQIYERATIFADTMQAIYDVAGTQDAYFAGINMAVSTNICVVCMLGVPLVEHRVCNISDVQNCMNDFSGLLQYVTAIEKKYFGGKRVKVDDIAPKGNQKISVQDSNAMAENYVYDSNEQNNYFQTIYFVRQELLGAGREKMYDQARGLRNMINNFLANPRVRNLLTMNEFIDFDRYLKKGKITVLNTALEISSSSSTAFGSFFMLNFKQAVFRRPSNRCNHFWYIDEFPVYLNKETEAMFSLFRQYRVGMTVAIQTLDQFAKSAATQYLKGVVMGCSTHIVFGRLSPTDMKMYQDKAGMVEYDMEQATESHNASVLTPDEKATESVRVTKSRKNLMEGHDMSQVDFQEVTCFTIDEGKPVEPAFGKVAFLRKEAFRKKTVQIIDWSNMLFDPEVGTRKFDMKDAVVEPERKEIIQTLKVTSDAEQDVVINQKEIEDIRQINPDESPNKNISEFLAGNEEKDELIKQTVSKEIANEIYRASMDPRHQRKLDNLMKAEEDLDNVD